MYLSMSAFGYEDLDVAPNVNLTRDSLLVGLAH